ncbi:MAG: hypothetical protein IAF94_12065 [Pirellulaceae bacterium]|nr:hypothetical protein [Pirellulaceae bacterium]
MDAQEKEAASTLPKRKRSRFQLILIPFLVLVAMIVAIGLYVGLMNQAYKRANLQHTVLQELKQPHKIALDAIAADSSAKVALGENIIDAGGLERDGTGELDRAGTVIHFDVSGSKGKGRVTAPAALQQGAWQITGEIEIKLPDGKTIKVARPSDKPPDIDLGF